MTASDADGPEPRSDFDERGFDLSGTRRDGRVSLFATPSRGADDDVDVDVDGAPVPD